MSSRERGLKRVWYAWKKRMTILDLLVGDHPADKQDVGPVVVELIGDEAGSAAPSRCEKSGTTGSTAVRGNPSASRSCRLNSESPSARSQRSTYALQLAPSAETLPRERAVHADEVLGRRDVVVDERHPIGQRVRRARRLGAEREMVEQQVVGMAGVDELAVVARQRLEPADRPSRRRCPTRSRPRAARAGCPSTSWPIASP